MFLDQSWTATNEPNQWKPGNSQVVLVVFLVGHDVVAMVLGSLLKDVDENDCSLTLLGTLSSLFPMII